MDRLLTVNELAKIANVTVRTLHYYDEVELLVPSIKGDNRYRHYSDDDVYRLQQIVTLRELGFALKEIRQLVDSDSITRARAIYRQKDILIKKRDRLDTIILSIDQQMEDDNMSFDQYDTTEIDKAKDKYRDEAQQRWGDSDAYRQSTKRTDRYTKSDWQTIETQANAIYAQFVDRLTRAISASECSDLVQMWQAHITQHYYECTDEILAGLGQMYIADERFTENIDSRAKGLAQYMADSIHSYTQES